MGGDVEAKSSRMGWFVTRYLAGGEEEADVDEDADEVEDSAGADPFSRILGSS